MVLANPALVLGNNYTQAPMQPILNSPLPPHRTGKPLHFRCQTADAEARLHFEFLVANRPLRVDHAAAAQVTPRVTLTDRLGTAATV